MPKKVFLTTNISELLSGSIPIKYKDPDCPTIACIIGQTEISWALLDLEASINLLLFLVYRQLELSLINPTRVTINWLTGQWSSQEEITDVWVGEFIYPIDFIILETQ